MDQDIMQRLDTIDTRLREITDMLNDVLGHIKQQEVKRLSNVLTDFRKSIYKYVDGSRTIQEIAQLSGKSDTNTSRALIELENEGLVKSDRTYGKVYYEKVSNFLVDEKDLK